MAALREILAHFGVEVDTKQLEHGNHAVDGLIEKLTHFGHAVAGVFAFHAIESFVDSTVDEARALDLAAVRAGMTADEFQRLSHAANMADVGFESLTNGLRFFQRNASAARDVTSEAGKAFEGLGIKLSKTGKIDTSELLFQTADAIKAIDDPMKQTAETMAIFGRGGLSMLPMLKEGSEQLRKYAAEVDHLGGGFSDEFLEKTKAYEDHEKQLAFVWRGLRSELVGALIPGLLSLGRTLEKVMLGVKDLTKDIEVMQVVGVAAVVAIATKLPGLIALMRSFAASTLLPLAPLILAGLLVEDLVTWFQGGDSLIGRFFNQFDKRISDSAVMFGDAFGFMISSWDGFAATAQILPSAVGMAATMAVNEMAQAIGMAIAWVVDQWDKMLAALQVPGWLRKVIGSDAGAHDSSGEANQKEQSAAWDRSREQLGSRFSAEIEGGNGPLNDWQGYAKKAAKARLDALPQTTPGIPESTPWTGMVEAHAPVVGGAHSTVNDHSNTTVNVTVPGTTPATIAQKTGAAVDRAVKNNGAGHLAALEHTVD